MAETNNITDLNRVEEAIINLIEASRCRVAFSLNHELTTLYWNIGKTIVDYLSYQPYAQYGKHFIATLSQTLTKKFGRGYTTSALSRMVNVAKIYPDKEMFATLSQTLSWSHLIQLTAINDKAKRTYYQQMCIAQRWSLRELRKNEEAMLYERALIATKPEQDIIQQLNHTSSSNNLTPELVFKSSYVLDFLQLQGAYSEKELEQAIVNQMELFIVELGQGFAFVERQKRFSIDSTDYYLDLLFFHRPLNRLIAIDLKLGKFKPEYNGQMELYLNYIKRYEQLPHENPPLGLLLCSEGNTEHIELLMMGENEIKVAQYLTQLPSKQWFIDKLNRSIAIAQQYNENNNSTH